MAERSDIERLAGVDLFKGLARKELRVIAGLAKALSFPEGAVVAEEGKPGGRFFLILDGEAKVTVRGRTRRTLRAGDYFGEISLIDGEPRSATIMAATPLRTLALAEWNFRSALLTNPGIARKLLVELCRRLRSAESSVTA